MPALIPLSESRLDRRHRMATAIRNGHSSSQPPPPETFRKFFDCWLSEQNQHLQSLLSAAESRNGSDPRDAELLRLINRVTRHYEDYYSAKSRWARRDVLSMLSPSWRSSLEDAFLWIGGWRPGMAFHLLYSKSGLQLEASLADLINGISTGDLGDLSSSQLRQVDELQRATLKEEKEVTEEFAGHQETMADPNMVELSHAMAELAREERGGETFDEAELEGRVEETLKSKEDGLEEILAKADDLRLRTLKGILEILSPTQCVHFLIAAAQLHLKIHEWGKRRDAASRQAAT